VNYEAQAAIELENIINPDQEGSYHFEIEDNQVRIAPVLVSVLQDIQSQVSSADISAKFHNSIRLLVLEICSRISQETGCRTVAFSGGVWQNKFLLSHSIKELEELNYTVLIHHQVPANDGGLVLGQALIANYQLNNQ